MQKTLGNEKCENTNLLKIMWHNFGCKKIDKLTYKCQLLIFTAWSHVPVQTVTE